MPQAQNKMFTQAIVEKGSFNDDERSFIAWASKPVLDRDGEIIANDAWDIENFEKNPVILFAHDYSKLPVGKAMWLRKQRQGLKFKPKFAPTQDGRDLYLMYKEGFMNSFSVGFIPRDFEEDEDQMIEYVGWFGGKYEKPLLTHTDVELLEISCVPVPSCPDALVERMMNGEIKAKGLQQAIRDTMSKTVIPFKHYALDPEDASWDGPEERKEADVDDLKLMSTWFDSEDPDVKSSYKLPHHRAEGHNTVWRGTAAAMVALLGGRGGVDIPDGDRRGVYGHLKKHYDEFDKPVPEFKHYTEHDLKTMDEAIGKEAIQTSAGKISGGWEEADIEERDPVEAMRQEGLEKEKDNIIPVTTELWHEIMDTIKDYTAALAAKEEDKPDESEAEMVEYTDEEMSLLVQQGVKIRRQQETIKRISHDFATIKAKLTVLQGGIG